MIRPRFAALALLAALSFPGAAVFAAGLAVDLKFDESRAVSVPLGTDNGVSAESDFVVVVGPDRKIPIVPSELFPKRFWSAPLSIEEYELIPKGAPVERYSPDPVAHQLVRRIAAENAKQIRQEKASAKRWEQRKELDALREKREQLVDRRAKVEGWIAESERQLSGERDRVERSNDGVDADIDRVQQRIQDMTDQRNELQAQRDALPESNRGDYGRLTTEINRLNSRIGSERTSLTMLRDRKRTNKTFLARDAQEKSKLEAERKSIDAEIKALDFKIRELSAKLGE